MYSVKTQNTTFHAPSPRVAGERTCQMAIVPRVYFIRDQKSRDQISNIKCVPVRNCTRVGCQPWNNCTMIFGFQLMTRTWIKPFKFFIKETFHDWQTAWPPTRYNQTSRETMHNTNGQKSKKTIQGLKHLGVDYIHNRNQILLLILSFSRLWKRKMNIRPKRKETQG